MRPPRDSMCPAGGVKTSGQQPAIDANDAGEGEPGLHQKQTVGLVQEPEGDPEQIADQEGDESPAGDVAVRGQQGGTEQASEGSAPLSDDAGVHDGTFPGGCCRARLERF